MRDLLLASTLGLAAGIGAGLVVRKVARGKLEQAVLTGSGDLTDRLREGSSRALEQAPREVREGIAAGITDGLASMGLTRTELRQYAGYATQLQSLIRRFT
jgi:hypothetical protein